MTIAIAAFLAISLIVLTVDFINGRRVAKRMNAECDGMFWTGSNGKRYTWRNGRIVAA